MRRLSFLLTSEELIHIHESKSTVMFRDSVEENVTTHRQTLGCRSVWPNWITSHHTRAGELTPSDVQCDM